MEKILAHSSAPFPRNIFQLTIQDLSLIALPSALVVPRILYSVLHHLVLHYLLDPLALSPLNVRTILWWILSLA